MVKTPLYMTVAEFSEVLYYNVLSTNAFDPNERYHPADLATTFALSAEITGSTMEQVIANTRAKVNRKDEDGTD
jgi:hypothetical protein